MRNLAGVPGGKPLSVYFTAKREEKIKGSNCAALPRHLRVRYLLTAPEQG